MSRLEPRRRRSSGTANGARLVTSGVRLRNRLARALSWSLVVPLLRVRARHRLDRLESGKVTVVTVSWNSRPYLEVFLRAVRSRSPDELRILVVDNGSQDDSQSLLDGSRGLSSLRLPLNLGHDLALDLAFLLVETEYVISLDVDAFPLCDDWLRQLLQPLSTGSTISGARLNRRYVHPCCLAMRTARFVEKGHSFRSRYRGRTPGHDASGDVGEFISSREAGRLWFFEVTEQRGPGAVGTIFGDLVYHNFYSTRFRTTEYSVIDKIVERRDPEQAWDEALRRFNP